MVYIYHINILLTSGSRKWFTGDFFPGGGGYLTPLEFKDKQLIHTMFVTLTLINVFEVKVACRISI